jgi:hypothetical protein
VAPISACARRCQDDGDECTVESCEIGVGCKSTLIERAEGVICLLDRLAAAQRCEAGAISGRVADSIARQTFKAKAHAVRSIGAGPKRYASHVGRTLALLRALSRKLAHALTAGRIDAVCHQHISAALTRVRSLAENTTF